MKACVCKCVCFRHYWSHVVISLWDFQRKSVYEIEWIKGRGSVRNQVSCVIADEYWLRLTRNQYLPSKKCLLNQKYSLTTQSLAQSELYLWFRDWISLETDSAEGDTWESISVSIRCAVTFAGMRQKKANEKQNPSQLKRFKVPRLDRVEENFHFKSFFHFPRLLFLYLIQSWMEE